MSNQVLTDNQKKGVEFISTQCYEANTELHFALEDITPVLKAARTLKRLAEQDKPIPPEAVRELSEQIEQSGTDAAGCLLSAIGSISKIYEAVQDVLGVSKPKPSNEKLPF